MNPVSTPQTMNRRNFLKSSVVTAALLNTARAADLAPPPTGRAASGFNVEPQKDRHDAELLIMGGRVDLKVSGRDTGGDLTVYESIRVPKGGPALHRHHFQDEWFYVIRGEFIVRVGDETFHLRPGASAFAPRKIPHAFAKISEGEAQMLFLFQPAGSMEDFFAQADKITKENPPNQEALFNQLWASHGMEVVGPPLEFQNTP